MFFKQKSISLQTLKRAESYYVFIGFFQMYSNSKLTYLKKSFINLILTFF
jgi:hypothetical protein